MTATTGSGGLPGAGSWVGLGAQTSGMAEGAGQAGTQSRAGAALPSSTALVQTARAALVAAQAQQADVMLTLSEGAKSLLGSALSGSSAAQLASTTGDAGTNGTAAGAQAPVPAGAGATALVADVMQAADAVLNDPSATTEQKAMASQLMQLATTMAGQAASGPASGNVGGCGPAPALSVLEQQADASGALGGAVVTTSGLYGLASSSVQDGRLAMAGALAGMGGTQEEEIVLPGGIVQLPSGMEAQGALVSTPLAVGEHGLTNALSTALLPELFKALAGVLANSTATDAQKAAATALLQILQTADNTTQIPQVLLNPLLAAALMPHSAHPAGAAGPRRLGGEVEDMEQTQEAEANAPQGMESLRAALRKNAAYLAAVQTPLLSHVLQLTQKQEAEAVEAALGGWGAAGLSREKLLEDAVDAASLLAFSQNLMADSPYMGALASTSLTPILIMSWAALLSGCLPRAYPFVPRVWRRANKKKWRRKNRRQKMDFQNLLFTGDAVEA